MSKMYFFVDTNVWNIYNTNRYKIKQYKYKQIDTFGFKVVHMLWNK